MSKPSYTSGEWKQFIQDDDIFIETEGRIEAIAEIPGGAFLLEDQANAKLICAAPELLANLKNMIWNFSSDNLSEMQKKAIEYARKVVSEIPQ